MHADPTPDPALVDAVALRVLDLLDESPAPQRGELLTVAEVAARYRVQPSWVYAHKRELGVVKLGDGPKARLRFDAKVVDAILNGHVSSPRRHAAARPTRPRRRRAMPSRTPPPLR